MREWKGRFRRASVALGQRNAASVYVLFSMWALLTLLYYLGELVDLAGWDSLRWEFLYGVHDLHRILFLAPILYAAFVFGLRATVMVSILSLMAFLPRALFISPFPDPLARALIFSVFAGVIGCLVANLQRESLTRLRMNVALKRERDKLLKMLNSIRDGVVIVGPDHRIRYMNQALIKDAGDGIGAYCYERFRGLDRPCGEFCRLQAVLGGETQTWVCSLQDGRRYEVVATAYMDSDGVVCQLATLRDVSRQKR